MNKKIRTAKGTAPWKKPRPGGLGKPKTASEPAKAAAKARAEAAGRPYPNLVDNMWAAKEFKGRV